MRRVQQGTGRGCPTLLAHTGPLQPSEQVRPPVVRVRCGGLQGRQTVSENSPLRVLCTVTLDKAYSPVPCIMREKNCGIFQNTQLTARDEMVTRSSWSWLFYFYLHLSQICRFLGYVDKIGTAFEAKEIGSAFGIHLSIPMIREAREKKPNLSREDAKKVSAACVIPILRYANHYMTILSSLSFLLAFDTFPNGCWHQCTSLGKNYNSSTINYY